MKNAGPATLTFALGLLVGSTAMGWARPEAPPIPQESLVSGIGGVFFLSEDPDALRGWYREHLRLETSPAGTPFFWRDYDDPESIGRTIWSVLPAETDYFGPSGQKLMLNYRVPSLDRTLAVLAEQGIEPVKPREDHPYGNFAWIEDLDGNRIELWESAPDPGR